MNDRRTFKITISMFPDTAERAKAEALRRPRYTSLSALIVEALEVYLDACDRERGVSQEAPVAAHKASLRVLPNDKE